MKTVIFNSDYFKNYEDKTYRNQKKIGKTSSQGVVQNKQPQKKKGKRNRKKPIANLVKTKDALVKNSGDKDICEKN